MHVGVVHNTKSGSLSVSKISSELDPATGKEKENYSEEDHIVIDIYPDKIKTRLRDIARGKYEDCSVKMVKRVYMENPAHEVLGTLFRDGDLICLKHNLDDDHHSHHSHTDHDHGGEHSHADGVDDIDKLAHGDKLDPAFIGGLLGNLHDLKQFD